MKDILTGSVGTFLSPRIKAITKYSSQGETIQKERLHSLVHRAAWTRWGVEHGYTSIFSYEDFRRNVPLSTYEDLKDYIEMMLSGRPDILWRGRVSDFAISSGTTSDRSKFIPVSQEGLHGLHMKGGPDVTACYLRSNPSSRVFHGQGFILAGSFKQSLCTPTARCGDVSAFLRSSIPLPLEAIVKTFPSVDIALEPDFEKKREHIAQLALQANVTSLSGVPSWMLSVLSRVLEVTGKANLLEVWPNLEFFAHGGVGFAPYREIYRKLIPSPDMHYIETYNASEGFFGVQTDPYDSALTLMLDYDIFYEFIPMSKYGTPEMEAIPLWEVRPGENYALVISTSSGLWRYIVGDTIRFTRMDPPRFVITGRTRQFINAFGEEVIVENAEGALKSACSATGALVKDYTAAPFVSRIPGQSCHQWMVEFEREPVSSREGESPLESFTRELDESLRALNSDYDAKRYHDITLRRLQLFVARPGLFDEWMKGRGKMGGQGKVPRLSNDRTFIEPLLRLNGDVK